MATIIDGKRISAQIKDEVREGTAALAAQGITLTLAVVQVGEDPASTVYVRNKQKACEYTGIVSVKIAMPEETTQEELLAKITELNADPGVNGILVQLPLPKGLNADEVIRAISPLKDVDGFHPQSVGALSIGLPGFKSCTPAGIIELIKRTGIETEGRECVIVGRSNIVGKPMAMMMIRENATVTVAHSKTVNLPEVCRRADILITAVGRAKMFGRDYVKPGAAVIDCGMNRDENGKLCGDVDYEDVFPVASAITPVPGGVGPMTVAMLMKNCLESARIHGPRQMSRRMRRAVLLMAVAAALVIGFCFYQYRVTNTRQALVAKSVELAAEGSYADATRAIDKAMSAPQDGEFSDNALLLKKSMYLQKAGDTEQAMAIAMRVIKDTEEGQQEFDDGWARIISICSEEEEYDKLASILEGSGIDSVKSRYYNYLVYDPVFRDLPGSYEDRLVLIIESQGVGSVFYTLDGSDPTEKSNLYTGGILLRPGIYTVKAMFVNRYGLRSNIVTGTYQILEE